MTHELITILIRCSTVTGVAVLIALALRHPLRRWFGAQAAYQLWLLVPIATGAALLPAPSQPVGSVLGMMTMSTLSAPATAISAVPAFDPQLLLLCVWLIGALAMLAGFVLQQQRYLRNLGPLSGIDARTLRAESNSGCPALVGALWPRVVLPSDFETRYAPRERELVLAHERAHLQRGDAQINALVAALRCLQWFNPLVHFAASRFRFDQELACDAIVISRFPEARRCYADAMLKTQLAGETRQELRLPAGCYWPSSHPLKERIAMLKRPLPGRTCAALGLSLAVVLIGTGSYVAWAAQPAAATKPANAPASSSVDLSPPDAGSAPQNMGASYRRLTRIAYPAAALAAKQDGVVYISVQIAADGRVTDTHVDSVHPMAAKNLADAAMAAVKTWTFNPAIADGRSVASKQVIPVAFTLDPEAALHLEGGTLDAIRVSPPQDDASLAVDAPATENVEFRKIHPPKYPASAIKAQQQGKVVLKVHVDARGNPVEAKVYKTDPSELSPEFGDASIAAVMQYQFNPATRHGKAVDGWVLVPFTFSLTEK